MTDTPNRVSPATSGLKTCLVNAFGRTYRSSLITPRLGSEVDGNVLRVEVLVDPLAAAFASDARLLHAAELRGRVADHAAVETDHADVERLDDTQRPLDVVGEDVGDQPVLAV